MIHINGVGYCNESGAQMAVNDLLKVNQQQAKQLELYASRWASAMSEITKLQAELAASQSSHKALETLYLQVRDEELVDAKAEAEKYRDTLYSAKMMDKDKEIQRLKALLDRPWNTLGQEDPWEAYAEWEAWIVEQFPKFSDVIEEWEDNVASWLKPHIYGVFCDMVDKPKAEIAQLKERLNIAEDVIHRNELTVYYRQALAAQPQKESECNV